MKLNIEKFSECMRTNHKFKLASTHVSPKKRFPFPKETVILKAFECERCGFKDVQVIQEGDEEWIELYSRASAGETKVIE